MQTLEDNAEIGETEKVYYFPYIMIIGFQMSIWHKIKKLKYII